MATPVSKITGIGIGDVLTDGSVPFTGAVKTLSVAISGSTVNGSGYIGNVFHNGTNLTALTDSPSYIKAEGQQLSFYVGGGGVPIGQTGIASNLGMSLTNSIGLSINVSAGTVASRFALSSASVLAFAGGANWYDAPDIGLQRRAAGVLAQYQGIQAQQYELYNTRTDASNYERGFLRWASNVLEIGTEAAGTGTKRGINFYGSVCKLNLSGDANNATLTSDMNLGLMSTGSGVIILGTSATVMIGGYNDYSNLHYTQTTGVLQFGRDITTPTIKVGPMVSDGAPKTLAFLGSHAYASAATNITGGPMTIRAGNGASSSAGNAHGGNLTIGPGTGYGTGHHGYLILENLPTSSAGLPSGAVWKNSNVLTIVP